MDFDSLNNVIVDSLSHTNRVRYALYSAKLVIHIFEKEYPDDKKLRQAIEAVEKWIRDPSDKNKKKCALATNAAYAAYSAAYDATCATNATNAACAVAYVADAAAYSAAAYVADAATYSADAAYMADNSIGNLILRYGVELIIEEGKEVSEELRGIEMDIRMERVICRA